MQVAQAASAAFGEQYLFAIMRKVGDDLTTIDVGDDGSYRHVQNDVVGAFAVTVRAAPGLAVLGAMHTREAVIHQRVDVAVGNRKHAATASAVTAIRSAFFDVFLVTKAGRTVAAVTRYDFNFRFVDEFHDA